MLCWNTAMNGTSVYRWKRKVKESKKGKGVYATKRVAAGAHLPHPWFLIPWKTQALEPPTAWTAVSSPVQATGTRFYTWVEWGAPYGRKVVIGLGPMSIPSEMGHLALPIDFLAWGKIQMTQASFEPGTSRSRVLRSAIAPHWLGSGNNSNSFRNASQG